MRSRPVTASWTIAGAVTATALLWIATVGCTPTVRVEHRVEPVHITADINLRIDRELDEFFDFQRPPAPATSPAPAAPPASDAVPAEPASPQSPQTMSPPPAGTTP